MIFLQLEEGFICVIGQSFGTPMTTTTTNQAPYWARCNVGSHFCVWWSCCYRRCCSYDLTSKIERNGKIDPIKLLKISLKVVLNQLDDIEASFFSCLTTTQFIMFSHHSSFFNLSQKKPYQSLPHILLPSHRKIVSDCNIYFLI